MTRRSGYITITFEFHREGRRWVGYCNELGTSTFGRSIPETESKLKEAVLLHVNTLEELGETERFFSENSIEFKEGKAPKDIYISVPFRREAFYKPYVQPVSVTSN